MIILINDEPHILSGQVNNLLIFTNMYTNKLTFKYIENKENEHVKNNEQKRFNAIV